MVTDQAAGKPYIWRVLRVETGKIEDVECYPTLGAAVWEMANSSWEEPGNGWLSYVEHDGQVVATAVFGPDSELLVACADGRTFRFPEPYFYQCLT